MTPEPDISQNSPAKTPLPFPDISPYPLGILLHDVM